MSNFLITQGTGIKSLNSIISDNCPYFDKDAKSMNGKNILGINNLEVTNIVVGTATTSNSNQLVPQRVLYTNADANIPNITDDGCRFVAINTKLSAYWDYGIGGIDGPITHQQIRQNVTASALYKNLLWVGTDHGQLFYYDRSTSTWIYVGTGTTNNPDLSRINCLQVYNDGTSSYLAVGGKFANQTYSCMYAINSNYTQIAIASTTNTVTSNGLDDEVKCFYDNVSKDCLYIGGKFSFQVGGSSDISTSFITFKYDTLTWYGVFNNAGDNGFYYSDLTLGTVNSFCQKGRLCICECI